MLVTNNKSALYNGVNQQSPEHRTETQVEECINAYPTVNNGLLKRNPTKKLTLSDAVSYSPDMYVYEYDRGLLDGVEEKYSLQITPEQFQIIDVKSGNVKTKANGGIVFEGTAENYFQGVISPTSFSAITIKDTTFIVNKNKTVNMSSNSIADNVSSSTTALVNYADILLGDNNQVLALGLPPTNYPPLRWKRDAGGYLPSATIDASTITIIVDGKTIILDAKTIAKFATTPPTDTVTYKFLGIATGSYGSMTMPQFKQYCIQAISSQLSDNYYVYSTPNNGGFRIVKIDGTSLVVSADMTFPTNLESPYYNLYCDATTLGFGTSIGTTTVYDATQASVTYKRQAYLWVKSSNPTTAYSYTATITYKDAIGVTQVVSKTVEETTTELAATEFGTQFNVSPFITSVNGSIVQISVVSPLEIISITTSDTYGNQAVIGWANEFSTHLDLPKTMPFTSVVKIVGTSDTNFKGYWLKSVNGVWEETLDPYADTEIDKTTMPHIMTREFSSDGGIYFKIKAWDGWVNMRVGDADTNKLPSFIGEKIKDIFFFKNRLGFITPYSCIMSEVGEYGNFFRTTVTTLLESDRIDTSVDSTQAIELEYATYLEDSLMLFSDKAQFKLEGGKVLSPSTVQISQTSAYEINKYVRPVFVNDKVFFCAKRGNYTAVMQYYVSGDGRISEAMDITAHCDKYIPDDVTRLAFSSINNCIFLTSKSNPDTIFVYKYLDSGNQRVQSAWFKWTYNGEIYNMFSLGVNLNIMLKRFKAAKVTNWILGSGIWDSSNLWTTDGVWYADSDALFEQNAFEVQAIHPTSHLDYFVDATDIVEDVTKINSISSETLNSYVELSTSIYTFEQVTVSVISSTTNLYSITAYMDNGATYTVSNVNLVIPRNIDRRITKIRVTTLSTEIFVLDGLSAVYLSDDSNQLLFNNSFQAGLINWTLGAGWSENYGVKELGSIIPVQIDLGEWVLMSGGKANLSGTLKFKTCQISSEEGSDFGLKVSNIKRNNDRIVKAKYTQERRPMIYGDAKDIRLSIINDSDKGFRINSVTLEGNFNTRSRRS